MSRRIQYPVYSGNARSNVILEGREREEGEFVRKEFFNSTVGIVHKEMVVKENPP